MSSIQVRGLRKVYPTGVVAVDDLDLDVDDGELLVLLGPTSCGKSTVLRMIAGLERATAGEIRFDGKDVDHIPARDRSVALVFQELALYPHLTVAENIGFPLMYIDEASRSARVGEVSRLLGVQDLLKRRPSQLSGGQRQRVAMARAIARQPRVFLLDQPLSSLDASARDDVRADILDLAHTLDVATVYVTHDQVEALCLADRVAVMRKGRIEQLGTPEQVYSDPQRLFVAAFVGNPRMNLIQAAVYAEPDVRTVLDLGSQTIDVPWSDPRARVLADHHTSRITVGVRPDAIEPAGPDAPNGLRGTVRTVELRGHDALVHVETGCAPTPHLLSHLELPDAPGELAHLSSAEVPRGHPMRDRLLRLVPHQRRADGPPVRYAVQPSYDAQQDAARQALGDMAVRMPTTDAPRPGEKITLSVDLDRLYFFDGLGERIRLPTVTGVSAATTSAGPAGG